ncbi:MAG: hypothetical protein RBT33_03855 [Candidatus Dojkabacteria bacterium]|jgi:predicted HTH transcriptional regulator|nr:hypothetical protein [Candidatus Dojkabacteria bacterium]
MFKKNIGFLISFTGVLLFLLYITKGRGEIVKISRIEETEPERVQSNSIESVIKENSKELNKRQEEILKLYKKRYVLLPSDIYAINPSLSTRTFRRDMSHLVSLGIVIQEGSTKDTRYLLKK